VVLIEDVKQQEIYRRLMELGGAKVERWTLQHLVDLPVRELAKITHIISHPIMLVYEVFRKFLLKNDEKEKIPVVAYIYVGDFLTRRTAPTIHSYDIRQQAMHDVLITTEEAKLKIEQAGRVRPPDYLLRPVALPSRTRPIISDPGPSLQESPDLLDDDIPDDCSVDNSPGLERNLSQVISLGLPEDYEYDNITKNGMNERAKSRVDRSSRSEVDSSTRSNLDRSARKRGNNSANLGKKSKKAKLNVPDDSGEEIEILEETPTKYVEEKNKGLLQLKRKAQLFMRASAVSANTSQSKLDDWVVRSPRKAANMDDKTDDQDDIIFVEEQKQESSINRRPGGSRLGNEIQEPEESRLDRNAGPDQPSRRQRKSSPRVMAKSKSVAGSSSTSANHFLVKARSGSIRKSSSVRSHKSSDSHASPFSPRLPLSQSMYSTISQDSFCSEVGSDIGTPVKSLSDMLSDQPGQKTFFCNNLLVQRRTLVHRLDVGVCALPIVMITPNTTPSPLPSSMCANLWTCLDTEQELKELNKEVDESWLAALTLLTKVVNMNRFAPVAALHKVLTEALRDHKDNLVRTSAHKALLHCLDMLPPGPDRPEVASYYLELMSKTIPHLDKWEFDCVEPWEFLGSVIVACVGSHQEINVVSDYLEETSGHSLLLNLLTEIFEADMTRWFDHMVMTDDLETDYKPILAQVLFPSESVGWSRRVERLCKLYMEGVAICLPENDLSCIRKLVGLAAQLIQFKERSKSSHSNSRKMEMVNFLTFQFSQLSLTQERLWAELYLLQPTWLVSMISRQFLTKICNCKLKDEAPALRSLISNFIDTDLEFPDSTPSEYDYPTPSQTSTPLAVRHPARQSLRVQVTSKSPVKSTPAKKIKVNNRNKYGETPLHLAAKKGNLERLTECLNTPGIDINSKDFSGYTPLHEAVGSGKVEAVQLLLQHVPHSHTLDKYFAVSQLNLTSPRKKVDRVDLLAGDKDEEMNPVHEAVENNNLDITKLFLDTIAREQSRPNSGLPSVDSILSSTTKNGDTIDTLAKTDEMKEMLKSFADNSRICEKENCPTGPLFIPKKELFGLLTELSVTKYIAMNCLPHIYGMFKGVNVSEVLRAHKDNISIKLNEMQLKWGPMDLKDGLIVEQFSRRPRFDLFRSEAVKSQDMKDFENLIYYKKQYKKIDPLHPALPMLKLLRIHSDNKLK